ncbi:MAG: redoxin domain-containing protein [Actinobacteria bacterium]|nr:redoxin domain-containing protein [Actinomycetota bacterium]
MGLAAGMKAPHFRLRDQNGQWFELSDLAGSEAMIIFMPYAFTKTCEGEMCSLRDNLSFLQSKGAKIVVITCDTKNSNRVWSEQQGFSFPILSDFWPHGQTASAFGCFNEKYGFAERATFVVDAAGTITDIVSSANIGIPRDFDQYAPALGLP